MFGGDNSAIMPTTKTMPAVPTNELIIDRGIRGISKFIRGVAFLTRTKQVKADIRLASAQQLSSQPKVIELKKLRISVIVVNKSPPTTAADKKEPRQHGRALCSLGLT